MPQRIPQSKSFYTYLYIAVAVFILGYLLFKVIQVFTSSLFFQSRDRINIVTYGKQSAFYSIDKKDARHYMMYFPADLKMLVPGGYGTYRVGSLGKLANLDQNPDIFRKTFAISTTSFLDFYFYDGKSDVYDGKEVSDSVKKPALGDILFMKSNANIFDRIYLVQVFMNNNADDFYIIDYSETRNKIFNDVYFGEDSFIKESIGLLYQKKYRDEQKSVQLLYRSYDTAQHLGALLEGNGIRVNDLSANLTKDTACSIIESGDEPSETAKDLSHYFKCPIKKGSTDVYDIIFVLGSIEEEWE